MSSWHSTPRSGGGELHPPNVEGRKKTIKTKLFVAENGPFGTPFGTPNFPRKSLCGSPFCVLSQEMRHINFFLGVQTGAFRVRGKKFMLKSLCAFSVPYLFGCFLGTFCWTPFSGLPYRQSDQYVFRDFPFDVFEVYIKAVDKVLLADGVFA